MEIKEFTPDMVGKEISCNIDGTFIPKAEIYQAWGNYYILQNYICGGHSDIVRESGTKYLKGWCILGGDFKIGLLTGVRLLEPSYEIY